MIESVRRCVRCGVRNRTQSRFRSSPIAVASVWGAALAACASASSAQESSEESTAERSQPEDWTTESEPADSLAATERSHSAAHADLAARSDLAALPIP